MTVEPVRHELTIEAPAEVVFELLTDADGLLEWLAVEATVDLRPGGEVSWTHANGATVSGHYVEVAAPRRLVFTYGWVGDPVVGPGRTTVEIELDAIGPARTGLRLVHRDLPDGRTDDHRHGWTHFLGLLADLAATRPTG